MRRFPTRTQIQVVVFSVVLAIGIGLVLSAIQKVRDAAAQMQCSNNLRQLGTALQSCDSAQGRLPMLTDQGEGSRTGKGLPSILFSIIPYLESTELFYHDSTSAPEAYNASSSIVYEYGKKFQGMRDTHQYGGDANQFFRYYFICPTDPTAHRLRDIPMTLPDGSTGYYATGSYAVNGHLPWGKGTLSKPSANTILLAERPQVCRTATGETVYNLWGVGFYSPHMPAFAALAPPDSPESWNSGLVAAVRPLPGEESANQLRVRIGREDAATHPPDFRRPFQRIYADDPCDPRLPSTPHRSGMLCVMADGSTHLFSHGTTPWVFWSACVPTGEVEK